MKNAYVSVVLVAPILPDVQEVASLDRLLASSTRDHEILIASHYVPHDQPYQTLTNQGPISLIYSAARASRDDVVLPALTRSVGDFILEWRGAPTDLTADLLDSIFEASDLGAHVVEIKGVDESTMTRLFYRLANLLRPLQPSLARSVGRLYSRSALQAILKAVSVSPSISVTASELPVKHAQRSSSASVKRDPSFDGRFGEGLRILMFGTRAGTIIPLIFALVSALLGVSAGFYALLILVTRDSTPEGWTTIMTVLGFGQAALFVMVAAIWHKVSQLPPNQAPFDHLRSQCLVIAPWKDDGRGRFPGESNSVYELRS